MAEKTKLDIANEHFGKAQKAMDEYKLELNAAGTKTNEEIKEKNDPQPEEALKTKLEDNSPLTKKDVADMIAAAVNPNKESTEPVKVEDTKNTEPFDKKAFAKEIVSAVIDEKNVNSAVEYESVIDMMSSAGKVN